MSAHSNVCAHSNSRTHKQSIEKAERDKWSKTCALRVCRRCSLAAHSIRWCADKEQAQTTHTQHTRSQATSLSRARTLCSVCALCARAQSDAGFYYCCRCCCCCCCYYYWYCAHIWSKWASELKREKERESRLIGRVVEMKRASTCVLLLVLLVLEMLAKRAPPKLERAKSTLAASARHQFSFWSTSAHSTLRAHSVVAAACGREEELKLVKSKSLAKIGHQPKVCWQQKKRSANGQSLSVFLSLWLLLLLFVQTWELSVRPSVCFLAWSSNWNKANTHTHR